MSFFSVFNDNRRCIDDIILYPANTEKNYQDSDLDRDILSHVNTKSGSRSR